MRITVTDSANGPHEFGDYCPCSGCRAVRWAMRRAAGWGLLAFLVFISITVVVSTSTNRGDETAIPALAAFGLPFVIYFWRKPRIEVLKSRSAEAREGTGGNGRSEANIPSVGDLRAMTEKILAEDKEIMAGLQDQMNEIAALTPEELAWVEWHVSLPEAHKQIVDGCVARGIRVTPDNFDKVLARIEAAGTS